MEKQSEGLKHNPHLMLIDDADRPAKWYFGLKAAYLEVAKIGWRNETSAGGASHVEVEKLRSRNAGVPPRLSRGRLALVTLSPPPANPSLLPAS